jgi:predicted transcriptional regulator
MDTREQLLKQLESLEQRISEIKDRLPAHSAKPGMMMELMDLEDERDRLLSRLGENENSE